MADQVKFHFSWNKALDAMYVIVSRLGHVEKVKLMKLLYLVDREHFLSHGTPITGDRLMAMPYGPVPSRCLNAVNGDLMPPERDYVSELLHREDHTLMIRQGVERPLNSLSPTEKTVIDQVLAEWGDQDAWGVVDATHKLPEYDVVYQQGTSTPIEFETILRCAGDARHWRHNRPVISKQTAAAMATPAWANEKWDD